MICRRETKLCFRRKNRIKKIAVSFAALLMALFLPAQVIFATENEDTDSEVFSTVDEDDIVHNEQEIDPETGTVVEDGTVLTNEVTISDDATYNAVDDTYTYTFGDDSEQTVTANVANGMYTNETVSLSLGSEIQGTLYLGGTDTDLDSYQGISTPGNYVMRLSSLEGEDLGSFTFRITDEYTNTSVYEMPDTFSVTSATFNGSTLDCDTDRVTMNDEGEYDINYENDVTGVAYNYHAIVDHTAPTLALEAVNENGYAHSAVDISDMEDDATIVISRDDNIISYSSKLTVPGRYSLVITDAAGNITIYQFVIYMYFTMSSIIVVILIVLINGGLIAYLVISSKNIRVR